MVQQPPLEHLAADDEDGANSRYRAAEEQDPFPAIPPALLNSADIEDYIRVAAIVHPFSRKQLKSASYSMKVGNSYHYWNEKGVLVNGGRDLKKNEKIIIPKNSIIFVTTQETFRLPPYIAARFNLHITLVHQGLLLGTGPLVDPGFGGRLVIPIHNLTSNNYSLEIGDDLIWVEFTKISPLPNWHNNSAGEIRQGQYVAFPEDKKNKPFRYYITKALNKARDEGTGDGSMRSLLGRELRRRLGADNGAEKIANSIPTEVREAHENAKAAKRRATMSVGGLIATGIVLVITVVIGLLPYGVQVMEALERANTTVEATTSDLEQSQDLQRRTQQKIQELIKSQTRSEEREQELSKIISELQSQIDQLRKTGQTMPTEPAPRPSLTPPESSN